MTATTIRGIAATTTVVPSTLDEAQALMTSADAAHLTIAFVGGGTELSFGYAPTRVDVLLDTSKLDRIVEYQPADMVVEVEAGVTLGALQAHLAPHGQRLALDAPEPERATIGGLVATNAFGPLRTRFGSMRDLIVGVSFIRADGARVRGGGKVVKNVAGFDLPKLAVGSLGSLGMIATVTLRLHPVPQAALGVDATLSADDVVNVVRESFRRQLEPALLVASRLGSGQYRLTAVFEGFESGALEQRERFLDLGRAFDPSISAGDDAIARVAALDRDARCTGDLRLRIALPPAEFVRAERDIVAPLLRAFADLAPEGTAGSKAIAYPSLGVAFFAGSLRNAESASRSDDASMHVASAIVVARRVAEARGGNLVVTHCDDTVVNERVDVYGTLPPSFALMRGLKDRFDPEHRLNPGRFLGKL